MKTGIYVATKYDGALQYLLFVDNTQGVRWQLISSHEFNCYKYSLVRTLELLENNYEVTLVKEV